MTHPHIKRLVINHVRNLHCVSLDVGQINIFIGQNGSGKTSVLESLHLLSRGKSFRHHQPKHYISHNKTSCTVWARLSDNQTLAILKDTNASTTLKLNATTAKSQSTLTKHTPLIVIDPSGMDILQTGTESRRQMLDWLAFHLDDDFYDGWLGYQKALKQRNSLLKSAPTATTLYELSAWHKQLDNHAKQLHAIRERMFDIWRTVFLQICQTLLPQYADCLQLSYHAGFDSKLSLFEILQNRISQDLTLGYTPVGVHRADIGIYLKQDTRYHAIHVLSRGEKKLLITALKLSLLIAFITHTKHTSHTCPLVLIDDIDSELDDNAIIALIDTLKDTNCQLFITSLNNDLPKLFANVSNAQKNLKVFHIKNGNICSLTD